MGAIHSAYYNNDKFRRVFEIFRSHFPKVPYLIYSDMGDDFSGYIDDYTFYKRADIRYYGTGPNAYWYDNWDIWHSYYERLREACIVCDTDYIILMEDDVFIANTFEITIDFDLCGPCGNATLSNYITSYLERKLEKKINPYYGLCGGSIFNSKKFLDNYDRILDNLHSLHYEYSNNLTEPIAIVGDGNFTIQFNLLGLDYKCSKWAGKEIIHPWKS